MIHTVLTYLEEAAAAVPEKVAFSDQNTEITYGQLYARARAIGSALHRKIGAVRRPVFICIGRNVASVLGFFGVVTAGCFYVPVDLSLPESRLQDIFRTMEPAAVITTEACTVPFAGCPICSLEELTAEPVDAAALDQIRAGMLDIDPLYCIFTSGSTGVPKGVLVSHRSVIDMAEQFTVTFQIAPDFIFGNQAPFDFDVSVKDIYLAVKNRATVCILERSLFSFPKMLIQRLNERKVNTLIWSVSAMKILSALKCFRTLCPEHLRLVMFSGEALPCRILNEWQHYLPGAAFVNLYGPTEITCNCTYYKVDRPFADDEALPIGRPFPNTGILLLDGDRPVTEPGESGEICVTGSCLALGYYADPVRTEQAFCLNPLEPHWSQRIYRTGDLGRWNEAGELQFLGRADSQVKHMGFRIELGEIETAANALDFIDAACCLYHGEKEQLCLFYQAPRQDDKALLAALKEKLPAFMIPRRLYYFDKMPENRTGKIDRAYLRKTYF